MRVKRESVQLFGLCIFMTLLWIAMSPLSAGAITKTFNYSGVVQNFTVPNGVTSITIQAFGAQGGNGYAGASGGNGGSVTATIAVAPGDMLYIRVGGQGGTSVGSTGGSGGYNGGGNGGSGFLPMIDLAGSAGGGASDVRQGVDDLNHRVVVAGGGGGASTVEGGAGGYPTGTDGTDFSFNSGGGGGGQSSGGSGKGLGISGTLGTGGDGGDSCVAGGGGGGGYYGGGGGAGDCVAFGPEGGGGGGGGSSYAIASASGVLYSQGVQTGNGQVIITYSIPVPTLSEWGMIIFMVLAGLGSVFYLTRQKRA
jgi:hypothetical protein